MALRRDEHYTYRVSRAEADMGDAWILCCLRDGIEIDRRVFLAGSYGRADSSWAEKIGLAHQAAEAAAKDWLLRTETARFLLRHRQLHVETALMFAFTTAFTLLLLKPSGSAAAILILVGAVPTTLSTLLAAVSYFAPNAYVGFIASLGIRPPLN